MQKQLVLFVFLFPFWGLSQTLKGNVQNPQGGGLPFVSVGLLNRDSSVVKATATDAQGQFVFEKIKAGSYLLTATAIGYQKGYSAVFEANGSVSVLVLQETSTQLKEVQVVTKRPFVEQQLDRTVVNVANSIVGSGSTALEVLTKAPGVTVDFQRELIELRGKEGVVVQLDGKQSYLSGADLVNMLRAMSSDNIDKIEIISNPSAKFDAAGNAGIINIRLKKNVNFGTNGLLSLGAGSGQHYRTRGGLQLNHRTEKWNIFGNYSANKGGNFWDLALERDQPDGSLRNYIDQHTHLVFDEFGQNAKVGLDYSPGKNTTIGAVWTGFWTNHDEDGYADFAARRTPSEAIYLQTNTQKVFYNNSQNQLVNFNFQHNFKNKGQLSADVDWGLFRRANKNNLITTALILTQNAQKPIENLINETSTAIDIRTFKADYSAALSKIWKMEAGLKHAYVNSINDITLQTGDKGKLVLDPNLSSHFEYRERVNAGYVNLSGKIKNADIQAGLRAEHTHSVGSLSVPNQTKTRDYLNWFPSFFISKPISAKQTLLFSYSYRIDRPNYQKLNSARGFVDLYAYSQGNIDLVPQYTHAIELRYALKSGFFASLAANYITDLTFDLNYVVEGNKVVRLTQNMGNSQGYVVTVGLPITVAKAWQAQASLLGFYNQFQFEYEGKNWNAKNVAARLNFNNGFVLGHGWTAELNGWVNSPRVNTIMEIPWLSNVDAGVQKSVSQKMKLKLSLQNVFFTPVVKTTYRGVNSFQTDHLQMDTRILLLNLTYAFGNQKVKAARQRKTGAEDESRRAN